MQVDKSEAEKLFADLLCTFQRFGAFKERDELLGFRRRLRMFTATQDTASHADDYMAQMRDTVERLPGYSRWLVNAEDWDAAEKCDHLHDLLSGMLEMSLEITSGQGQQQG